MCKFLTAIRRPGQKQPISQIVLYTALLFVCGMALGTAAKLLDIYTQNLGNIFSQMSIWILLGTVIAVYSRSPYRAMANVFLFCVGMLIAYYAMAQLTNSVYGWAFIGGWTVFSLFSPLFAFLTWYAKGRGWFAVTVSVGILLCMLLCAVVLFDKLRLSDIVLALLTALVLFGRKRRS
jgi:hypothetical protein